MKYETTAFILLSAEDAENHHKQRIYQRMPRHMQRRALSNNPKRLPRRIRQQHILQLHDVPKPTKRPKQKYRPRPKDRVEEYFRRQEKEGNVWLETHVWHAKRFHMTRRWGYALPLRPTQKMYRPILRAVNNRCIMQVTNINKVHVYFWQNECANSYVNIKIAPFLSKDICNMGETF